MLNASNGSHGAPPSSAGDQHISVVPVGKWLAAAPKVDKIRLSPAASMLASISEAGAEVRAVPSGELLLSLNSDQEKPYDIDFSPQGDILAGSTESGIALWQSRGTRAVEIPDSPPRATCVAFNPDGTLLAAGVQGTVQLWGITGRKLLVTLPGHAARHHPEVPGAGVRVQAIAFSPTGERLAVLVNGESDNLHLWDVALSSGGFDVLRAEVVNSVVEPVETFTAIAFSPSGKELAVARSGRVDGIRMYSALSLDHISTLYMPEDVPMAMAYSAKGDLLAVAGGTGMVYIWHPARQRIVARFDAHGEAWDEETESDWAIAQGGLDWSRSSGLIATCGLAPFDHDDATQTDNGKAVIKLWHVESAGAAG